MIREKGTRGKAVLLWTAALMTAGCVAGMQDKMTVYASQRRLPEPLVERAAEGTAGTETEGGGEGAETPLTPEELEQERFWRQGVIPPTMRFGIWGMQRAYIPSTRGSQGMCGIPSP